MSDAPEFEIIAYEPSPIGMICLRRRHSSSEAGGFVTEITLDHRFLMSSCVTDSERALAFHAFAMHTGHGLQVLVGGLGLGYTAREALRCDRVARLDVVEFLPPVVDWLERELVPLAPLLKADARFAVTLDDVYRLLASPPARHYDVILIDVDNSPDEQLGDANASFYTEAGLALAKRHLAEGGVLGVWSYADSATFEQALGRVFHEVRVEPVQFENGVVGETETNWLFFARG
jgi:spermidine synthase